VTALANHAGVDRRDVTELAVGSLLHDVGKSQVPGELINKNSDLTTEEYELMKQHVPWGEQILGAHGTLTSTAMVAVSQHHEKLDGTGYPRNLASRDVHLFGRIAAIADTFDAMTTRRSYQPAMTAFDALDRMHTVLSSRYDQELLVSFIRMLRKDAASAQPASQAA
jgi:HD-GYP domain-containing protein (c-di-GMP phosphodiesterase class II)